MSTPRAIATVPNMCHRDRVASSASHSMSGHVAPAATTILTPLVDLGHAGGASPGSSARPEPRPARQRTIRLGTRTERIRRTPMTPVWVLAVDVREAQAVAQVEDEQDRQDRRPTIVPRAAEDADAAEQDHRDDVELEASARARPGPAPRRAAQQHAGERRRRSPLVGEDRELRTARRPNAREPRDLDVVAEHVDVPPEARRGAG